MNSYMTFERYQQTSFSPLHLLKKTAFNRRWRTVYQRWKQRRKYWSKICREVIKNLKILLTLGGNFQMVGVVNLLDLDGFKNFGHLNLPRLKGSDIQVATSVCCYVNFVWHQSVNKEKKWSNIAILRIFEGDLECFKSKSTSSKRRLPVSLSGHARRPLTTSHEWLFWPTPRLSSAVASKKKQTNKHWDWDWRHLTVL